VAGRSLEDDLRISLFAVGDDNKDIYAFAGLSIDFFRRFEADYSAKPVWLTENYRSSAHVIAAANPAPTLPARPSSDRQTGSAMRCRPHSVRSAVSRSCRQGSWR
jgi:superfamily I DNA/RNA helicase